MEPRGRRKHSRPAIKEEADNDDGDGCRPQERATTTTTTTQAMGLDRIMTPPSSSTSTMPVAWMLPTSSSSSSSTTTTTAASDYVTSSASSTAAPTSTTTATASSRIPAQDIILSTLHQLLDPTLQPPPPQPHQQLPRRPSALASPTSTSATEVVEITNRSSRSTRSTGTRTRPPPPPSSSSSSLTGRAVQHQHHPRQESSAGVSANSQRGAPPPTAISFPGYLNAAAGPTAAASAPGLPALVQDLSSSLPHLLQVAAFSGISLQALLASLVTALPAGVDPATLQLQSQPQRQVVGSGSGSTTAAAAAAASKAPAPMPHIPDPTYPRAVTTVHKLPLPKAHSGGGLSFTPSVTSAFTSLKRPGEVARSSPPRSPNPPPLSSASAARATTAGKPIPTSSVPLSALAVPGFPGLPPPDYAATLAALAASQHPPMAAPAGAAATTADHQAQMQQYMQFLLLLQQQQPPQQQLPPGFAVAPLPYITTPLVPIITAPAQSSLPSPSSAASTSTSTSGKRARMSIKQESGGTKRSRESRDDCPVTGRTSSNAGLAPTSDASDTAASRKRTRLDDQYGQLTDLGPPPRDSAQSTSRRRADASDDDDDAVKRKRINQGQLDVLEAAYLDDPLPSRRTKQRLSTQLGISIKRVQIWFQNRRAKQKRQRRDGSDSGGDTFPEDGSDDPPSGGLFGLMD